MVHKNGWRPRIDDTSAVPLYEQIVESAAFAIAAGELEAGDRLPSVRSLASELRINPNTAARAIREMESNGLSRPRRGVGSVVADEAHESAGPLAHRALQREIDATVGVARNLGLDLEETLASLSERWKESDDAPSA